MKEFTGSMVALITPMHANGDVAYDALAELIEWHISAGTSVIIAVGTTGESATLTPKEHIDVIEFTCKQVRGRIPVIAGTGSNATAEAIDFTAAAKDKQADACLLVVPYYNKPTQQGLLAHFKAVADAVAIPQLIYNVPSRTIIDILPETVADLSYHPNIVGIKEASGDNTRVQKLKDLTRDFILLSGEDPTIDGFMNAGGDGIISVTANVIPDKMAKLIEHGLRGRTDACVRAQDELRTLHSMMFIEPSPTAVKYALWRMGKCDRGIRLPLLWLSEQHRAQVDQTLADLQLL